MKTSARAATGEKEGTMNGNPAARTLRGRCDWNYVPVDRTENRFYTILKYYDPLAARGESVKNTIKRMGRDEGGKILILALIVLVVGGFILAPLLGLMSTGLVAGQIYERKTAELYAADAGIEDALWRIKRGDIPDEPFYLRVNERDVEVTIESTDAQLFIIGLLGLDKEKNWVHSDWVTFGRILEPGKAQIGVSWNGSGIGRLENVGIWLSDTCSYAQGQTVPDNDIRAFYPAYGFEQKPYSGGTAFIWTWQSTQDQPSSKYTPTATLTFQFTPKSSPELSIAFTMMSREDVGPSYDGSFNLHLITATAVTDSGTAVADIESQTTVIARAVISGCNGDEVAIISWNTG